MRLFSVLLAFSAAGLGVAAALYPGTGDDAAQLAEVTRISAAPDRSRVIHESELDAPRVFSSAMPLHMPAANDAPSPVKTKPTPQAAQGWTTVVIADPASSAAAPIKSSKPSDSMTRAELARDLQRELSRAGCYGGEINGAWTAPTRRAMAAFMERVNASLPIDEPDYILLTLVQGQSGVVCGATCPSGQGMAEDGRCVPQAVIAQASRKAQREEQRRRDEVSRMTAYAPKSDAARVAADARRSVDAKIAAARAAAKADETRRIAALNAPPLVRGPAIAARTPSTAASQPEVLPWRQDREAVAEATQQPSEPLPGRMSIGAAGVAQAPAGVGIATPPNKPKTLQQAVAPSQQPQPSGGVAVITPPAPRPAVRPVRVESELDRVALLDDADAGAVYTAPPVAENPPSPKIAKRPSPGAAARAKKDSKKYVYVASEGGYVRVRKGLPRPGSMPYLMMRSMGSGGFF